MCLKRGSFDTNMKWKRCEISNKTNIYEHMWMKQMTISLVVPKKIVTMKESWALVKSILLSFSYSIYALLDYVSNTYFEQTCSISSFKTYIYAYFEYSNKRQKIAIEQKNFLATWIKFEHLNRSACNKLSRYYDIAKFERCKFTNISKRMIFAKKNHRAALKLWPISKRLQFSNDFFVYVTQSW